MLAPHCNLQCYDCSCKSGCTQRENFARTPSAHTSKMPLRIEPTESTSVHLYNGEIYTSLQWLHKCCLNDPCRHNLTLVPKQMDGCWVYRASSLVRSTHREWLQPRYTPERGRACTRAGALHATKRALSINGAFLRPCLHLGILAPSHVSHHVSWNGCNAC